jgi:ferrous iron transport protein A
MLQPIEITTHLTLSDIRVGERVNLLEMGSNKGDACRLTSLGFTPGVEIEMTQNYGRGPLVVTLRGTRVALGRQQAKAIIVQREIA